MRQSHLGYQDKTTYTCRNSLYRKKLAAKEIITRKQQTYFEHKILKRSFLFLLQINASLPTKAELMPWYGQLNLGVETTDMLKKQN